jgi:hypothetical protein
MSIEISNGFTIIPNQNIVRSGLVFNLFTAPSSGTTWIDESGNGYNAIISGSATYVSNNGGGIKLNNTSANGGGVDFISVPYNIPSSTLTVEVVASFNPTSFWGTIWGNDFWSGGRGYLAYMPSSTIISYGKPGSQTLETITASNSIRHWTFVINGTQHSLYLNSVQVGTTDTVSIQTLFATSELYFGARHVNTGIGPADRMNSSITANQPVFYQMRVYNKALSTTEITQNFNVVRGTYGI